MATVVVLSADKVYQIEANSVIGGVIDPSGDIILNKPGGVTVNLGNAREGLRPMNMADINFNGSDPNGTVETITITDDTTSSDTWLNRLAFRFKTAIEAVPRLTSFFNEYGEFRVAPARENTTAFRVFVKEFPNNPAEARSATVPVMELMDDRTNRNSLWGIVGDGTVVVKGVRMSHTLVLGPTDPVPAETPVNTVIVRTT